MSELREQMRCEYLQALGIDVWQLRGQQDMTTADQAGNRSATAKPQSASMAQTTAAHVDEQPATAHSEPRNAASATQNAAAHYTHDCLLLCESAQDESGLLLDILRHIPALAGADDEFLRSHMVTARQLRALRPRVILQASAAELSAGSSAEHIVRIDIDQLKQHPAAGRRALWQQLQNIPWSR